MNEQRIEKAIQMLDAITSDIAIQLKTPEPQRLSGINDFNLKTMLGLLKTLREVLSERKLPPKHTRHRTLSRMVVDSWPLGTEIGNRISEFESYYVSLD